MLGVKIDPSYLSMRERTEAEKTRQNSERKQRQDAEHNAHWHPYTDPYAAYLAGDFAALHDFEQLGADSEDDAEDQVDIPF
jgi:hypothetical protein